MSAGNFLYPKFRLQFLPAMLKYALLGAVIAGSYGIVHDQITYSISVEYFTRLKFLQFHYADFGLPHRWFVAEIGFLATWWVGFIAGWFLARVIVPVTAPPQARSGMVRGFAVILSFAVVGSLLGYVCGLLRGPGADYSAWQRFATIDGVVNLPDFVRVAYIHNTGYMGGLAGLIAAAVYVRARAKRVTGTPG